MSESRDRVMERMYRSGHSQQNIATVFGLSRQRVGQILTDREVPTRTRVKRGRVKDGRLWKIRVPQHPFAVDEFVHEHVLALEMREGRFINTRTHVVVARDGDYSNTAAENLVVALRYGETHKDLVWRTKHPSGLMLLALRWAAMRVGHTPSQNEMFELTGQYPTAVHERFGSRRKADLAVGLLSNGRGTRTLQPLPYAFQRRNAHLTAYDTWVAAADAWRENDLR